MTLNDYVLNGPSTVIQADDRDPWVSWQHHLERTNGLRGGVDLVATVGTPVLAPTAGIMAHIPNDGSAGNSCRFYHDKNAGWKDVFSHISTYVGKSGQHFDQGDIIAYSGATGGVSPHVHRHLLDPGDVRRNPWDYFTGSSTAGGESRPITEEDDMSQGIYTRIGSGQNTGQIYHQDNPGAPLLTLVLAQWTGAAANGNKYADLPASDVQALMRRVGVIALDSAGRIIRNADGSVKVNFP